MNLSPTNCRTRLQPCLFLTQCNGLEFLMQLSKIILHTVCSNHPSAVSAVSVAKISTSPVPAQFSEECELSRFKRGVEYHSPPVRSVWAAAKSSFLAPARCLRMGNLSVDFNSRFWMVNTYAELLTTSTSRIHDSEIVWAFRDWHPLYSCAWTGTTNIYASVKTAIKPLSPRRGCHWPE